MSKPKRHPSNEWFVEQNNKMQTDNQKSDRKCCHYPEAGHCWHCVKVYGVHQATCPNSMFYYKKSKIK